MIIQHQFEIRQIDMIDRNPDDRKKIYEHYAHNGIRQIAEIIHQKMPYQKMPFADDDRYIFRLLAVPLDEYIEVRNKIRDILKICLDQRVYMEIGKLFKQLESDK